MRLPSARPGLSAVWAGTLLFAAGCGGGAGDDMVEVKGKLQMNGQPAAVDMTAPAGKALPPGETGRMKVMFYPVKAEADPIVDRNGEVNVGGAEMATVESDGSFHLGRGKGAGVRKGKYRIVITQPDPFSRKDLLNGKFSPANSKITREVDGKTEIVIDLGKPTG
jgi:hypothetical protein